MPYWYRYGDLKIYTLNLRGECSGIRTNMSNTIAAKVKNTPGNAGDAIVNSLLALKVENNGCLECSMIRRARSW